VCVYEKGNWVIRDKTHNYDCQKKRLNYDDFITSKITLLF
jgi:hypothetical protein